ncbi:hypothetical protein DFH27DRAFT_582669 [Peziza echinospora]|nr:hypothetical protein DFH27DRAFT_582669 [Peziza echinospora]
MPVSYFLRVLLSGFFLTFVVGVVLVSDVVSTAHQDRSVFRHGDKSPPRAAVAAAATSIFRNGATATGTLFECGRHSAIDISNGSDMRLPAMSPRLLDAGSYVQSAHSESECPGIQSITCLFRSSAWSTACGRRNLKLGTFSRTTTFVMATSMNAIRAETRTMQHKPGDH